LFGQHLYGTGGKYLIITEGEFDAMSAYQMLNKRYPVVSVITGTGTALKDIKNNIDFIETFNEVIFCFDNDKAGHECANECANLLTPGKAHIVPLVKHKDANDFLKHGDIKDFISSFWDKKRVQPDGIINLADIYDRLVSRSKIPSIPYPWVGVNDYLDGARYKELVTITSGSGMGKSSIIRELEHHFLMTTNDNIGILPLEEDPERTTEGIMGVHVSAQLHREKYRESYIQENGIEEYKRAFKETAGTGRLHVYDHFGSTSSDNIIAKTKYLIKGLNCKIIILDHLSIIVSAQQEDGDERKVIDKIMTELRQLTQETGVAMFLVSHLRRVSGDKGHENGAEVTLAHLRGSQSIAQLSDAVIGLERNQQADNDKEANLTKIRILKSRYTGQTGIATHLWFDGETGRLVEIGGDDEVKEFLAPSLELSEF
jgi:twinkle protein